MNKILYLYILIVLFFSLYIKPEIKGTYIMATICQDGIIVGADSRSVFYNNSNQIIAYYEKAPKLFQYNNIIVGMAGIYSLQEVEFRLLVCLMNLKTLLIEKLK